MTINCKGNLIDFSSPKIMGILNVTPDSFYDGGKYKSDASFLLQAEKMLAEGATFIDLGACSSKPNAVFVSEKEELDRILPVVELLVKNFPEIKLSIDTFRSEVAKQTVAFGAAMINDISAGFLDDKMLETVAALHVPYIMMHMRGTPQNMTNLTAYTNVVKEIMYYFSERLALARKAGISDVIIDLGFGFAKNTQQNFTLLQNLSLFKNLDLPILVGVSRKSMIYKTLNVSPQEALNGTTALHMIALANGASILRVHDVKEAMECVTLYQQLNNFTA
jgi:dihydropteroate synthase